VADEPSMAENGDKTNNKLCDRAFLRANAIFIRAATYCPKNYMDSQAGYHALAQSRLCSGFLSEDELRASTGKAMLELDRVVKERGKRSACLWLIKSKAKLARPPQIVVGSSLPDS
jgi:hypothetical protein